MENLTETILKWVKANRKQYLKACVKHWGNRCILTMAGSTGWQFAVKLEYCKSNPNFGDDLIALGAALQHEVKLHLVPMPEVVPLLLRLHNRYAKRIEERWFKRMKRPGFINHTKLMAELIERGFRFFKDEALNEIIPDAGENPLTIVAEEYQLVWPYMFEEHEFEKAEEINKKFGILGITKVI